MKHKQIEKNITNRESASLDKYLREIGKEELITAEEEVALAQRIRLGDQAALDKMTRANLRFVVSIAKQYQGQGLSLSDLINEGNLGLIKAVKRFDETRGFKFISYAVWRIRQSMLAALAEQSRIVRIPLNKVNSFGSVNKAYSAFEQQFHREPTEEELADVLNMSPAEVHNLRNGNVKHLSLNAPVIDESTSAELIDLLSDPDVKTDDSLDYESLQQDIRNAFSILSPREIEVLQLFFGFNGDPLDIDEIAEILEISSERVRQVKIRALKKILMNSRSRKLLRKYLK